MTLLLVRNLLRCFNGGEHFRLAALGDFPDSGRERVVYALAVCHHHLGGDRIPLVPLLKEERLNAEDFLSITCHGEQKTIVRRIHDDEACRTQPSGRRYRVCLIKNNQERVSRIYESVELCRPVDANEDGVLAILHLVKRSLAERAVYALTDVCDTTHRR
ncbi:MAG: hypothetical protein AAB447_03765 [Patescibacteria group bacterium]